jgi:imidazolonepropionase-like amidohydrolase
MTATIYVNARLVDGTGAQPVDNATVVVTGGRFGYAGPAAGAPATPADAEVVDLDGRTLLPGFFDCHVHFVVDSTKDLFGGVLQTRRSLATFERAERLRRTLHAGVTSARDLCGLDAGYRDAIARGLIDGPRLHVAIRMIGHTGGHSDFTLPTGIDATSMVEPMGDLADTAAEARVATRRLLRDGADVIKIAATGGVASPTDQPEDEGLTVEEISAVVDEVRRHRGRPVAAHAQGAAGIRNALRGGVTSIEHGYLIDDEGIDLMLERGAFLVPTLSTGEMLTAPGLPRHIYDKKARLVDAAQERISEAIRRGVKVAMGTDAGASAHDRNLRELGHLQKVGMSPLAAIRAGTLVSAELLGVDGELGTVTAGKLADLVVCDGDPVADLGLLAEPANIVLVAQGGRVVKNTMPENDG